MNTTQKLQQMLVERVDHSIYDSGSAYGYNHEAKRDYSEPRMGFHIRVIAKDNALEIVPVLSLYRHLLQTLEYDLELDAYFQAFLEQDHSQDPISAFLQDLDCHDGITRDRAGHASGYTYNYDTYLDQDFRWWSFGIEERDFEQNFVVIEIHGGCDARSGFTGPVLFKVADRESTVQVIYPSADYSVSTPSEHYCDYYPDGNVLEKAESGIDIFQYRATTKINRVGRGWVVYDEERDTLYCPETGKELIISG